MDTSAQLPPEFVEIIDRGVSCIVGSRDASLKPSVMRAVGSGIDASRREITVFLARSQSRQLLEDIAATGHIAVVFSEPATHRTVQVKATRASLRPACAPDEPLLARYLASMEHEILRVGHRPELTRAMLAHRLDDVVAVSFTVEYAFDQTPGPKAGVPFGKGAA